MKGYLAEEHEDDAGRACFPEFGIERENESYRLPATRPERLKAVQQLLAALPTHGFYQKKYGTAY
ncbi:hypothetical protein [Hymenobacter rubripertinctus]|uniref:Uncharacterized protein n=1 Tax=Hymenobacter rubripertinctus TaxID=2029981 RepID=A0A418R2E2_9BACT|nr:hypothetical protein [Hymenobacter rubripertinctus]RIY11576.1 hypothetical protein D0T11_07140 [Hymenobacter rubripertinctus]